MVLGSSPIPGALLLKIRSAFMSENPPNSMHKMPADLRKILAVSPAAMVAWEDITPLARNEWICWVISVKKPETRRQHIVRVPRELVEGKRRPCCWAGCMHR